MAALATILSSEGAEPRRQGSFMTIKRISSMLAILAVLLVLTPPTMAQDFDKGFRAAEKGDYTKALQEWSPLAEQGDAATQYNLGIMHALGYGTSEDLREAVIWFRRAADLGLPEAQNALGAILAQGLNPTEAVRRFRAAAEQGDAVAQYNLASMYAAGLGVGLDPIKANYWRNLAAAQGLDLHGTQNLVALAGQVASGHLIKTDFFSTPSTDPGVTAPEDRFIKISRDGGVLPIQNAIWSDRGREDHGTQWRCVHDKSTGLTWEVKHRDNHNDVFLFAQALAYARNASLCGSTNWRLPTQDELVSLVDLDSAQAPTIDVNYFPKTRPAFYWSSEVNTQRTDQALGVHFSNGRGSTANQASRNRARIVRSGR